MQEINNLLSSISPIESDKLLLSRGYKLAAEYYETLSHAAPLLEIDYHEVKEIHTQLNVTLIASGKKKK